MSGQDARHTDGAARTGFTGVPVGLDRGHGQGQVESFAGKSDPGGREVDGPAEDADGPTGERYVVRSRDFYDLYLLYRDEGVEAVQERYGDDPNSPVHFEVHTVPAGSDDADSSKQDAE